MVCDYCIVKCKNFSACEWGEGGALGGWGGGGGGGGAFNGPLGHFFILFYFFAIQNIYVNSNSVYYSRFSKLISCKI